LNRGVERSNVVEQRFDFDKGIQLCKESILQQLSPEQREIIIREAATLLDIHQLSQKNSSRSLQSSLDTELGAMRSGDLFPIDRFFGACGKMTSSNEDGFRELYAYLKRELLPHEILVYWTGLPSQQPTPLFSLRDEDDEDIYDELLGTMLQLAMDTPLEEVLGLDVLDQILSETVPDNISLGALDVSELQGRLFQERGVTLQMIHAYFQLLEQSEDDLEVGIIVPEIQAPNMMAADGLHEDINDDVVNLILQSMEHSELENIIDPDKLRGYLASELQSMWEGDAYDLQELWEVLKGAPGVNRPMLLEVFLRIERDNLEHEYPLSLPPDIVAMSPDQKAEFFERLDAAREKAQAALEEELTPLPIPEPTPVPLAEPLPAIEVENHPINEGFSSAPSSIEPAGKIEPSSKPLPDARALEEQRQRTASGRLPARSQSGRIRTARKLDVGDVPEKEKRPFPKWLLMLLVLSIVGAVAGYFLLIYKPNPTFEGSQVNNKVLNALPYVQDMRRKPGTLLLIVKPNFFKMQEEAREVEMMRIIKEAKNKLGVKKIFLFNESGQYKSKVEF
jgi:hypothetical protein